MIRSWIGLASWLLLGCGGSPTINRPAESFGSPQWRWGVCCSAGRRFVCPVGAKGPWRWRSLPAAWWMPWPYVRAHHPDRPRPGPPRRPHSRPLAGRIGQGAVASGLILLTQALALWAYECCTARTHELPWPLPSAIGATAALMGAKRPSTATPAIYTYREVLRPRRRVGPPPRSGDARLLRRRAGDPRHGGSPVAAPRGATACVAPGGRTLGIVLLAWLPLRLGLLVGLLVHRTIRLDPAARLET